MGRHRPTRSRRALVAALAATTVLVAGGTAAAAIADLDPADSSGATPGEPEPLFDAASDTTPDQSELERAGAAREDARQEAERAGTAEATGLAGAEGDSADGDDSTGGDSSDGSGDDADLAPTGEGGTCEASNYSDPQPTANGEQFDPSAMTAAHKSLPFDTMVEVTNPATGASVVVRINDRGPYIDGRCLDLSRAAFEEIASANQGVATVDWQIVA